MCIRHIQFFECPSKEGPPKRHRLRSNILCSHNFPCPESHWERRTSYYRCMCPGCSGESPAVPRERPYRDEWRRDAMRDEDWVQDFLDSLCGAMALWTWGTFHAAAGGTTAGGNVNVTVEDMLAYYRTFYYERRCKEHGHRPAACQCEPNGPLGFLYNPATAVRRSMTNEIACRFENDPVVQSDAARLAFAEQHRVLTAVCRSENQFFGGGVARQPFFSTRFVERRRRLLWRVIGDASRAVGNGLLADAEAKSSSGSGGGGGSGGSGGSGGWGLAHDAMELGSKRRANAVFLMGQILSYDNGISNARFSLAVERLAHVIQLPQWRTPSRIPMLEHVASVATRVESTLRRGDPFDTLIGQIETFFMAKRRTWVMEVRRYQARRMLFDQSTTPVDGEMLRGLLAMHDANADANAEEDCRICSTTYWDSYSAPEPSPGTASPALRSRDGDVLPAARRRRDSEASSTRSDISNQIRRLKWDDDPETRRRGYRVTPSGVDMFDHGEPPVRINHCGHVFGRSCLFNMWLTDPDTFGGKPRCRHCRQSPPDVVYQMVEAASGFPLRPEPPLGFVG